MSDSTQNPPSPQLRSALPRKMPAVEDDAAPSSSKALVLCRQIHELSAADAVGAAHPFVGRVMLGRFFPPPEFEEGAILDEMAVG